MNATIYQHIPNWSDADSETSKFSDLDSLLSLPWVKSFSEQDGFHRFSVDRNNEPNGSHWLMAELNGGKSWHVVGKLSNASLDELPDWIPIK